MKEFKDYTIADFTERVKMPKTNLVGKRVIAPIAHEKNPKKFNH